MILNHLTAGLGSDENAQLPPGGKKTALGPGRRTLNTLFHGHDTEIIATLYCGAQYYLAHQEEVNKKIIGFAKKIVADAVLCGPAMHYANFGMMAAQLSLVFGVQGIPSVVAMSEENPAFGRYAKEINIIKMPKKGGIGLNDSYKNISSFISALAHQNQSS
ncbi:MULTISPECIES: GrdB-related putative oxidoreductase [Enterococcus]|uniref:GrdB-related putative oxidoreductase n=1 Tax=Enterococcus TaxID=1350 RepID=UPI000ACBFD7F|nr:MULTISPECIES: GrdB-related putative oxidoreductase [Enterococcus]